MMRKIAVVTGSRAEYGHLYSVIKGIHEAKELELQLIVTGTHLSERYGMTVQEIIDDGFPITKKVKILTSSDTGVGVAQAMGNGMIGLSLAYEKLNPDILLVLGDRFEIFAAVAAALPLNIPVAHLHGGELTLGAIDEMFRHAITKMSHIHFTSAKEYAQRLRNMGENPSNIFNFGAPGLDRIISLELMDKNRLAGDLKIPSDKNWGLVTFHPVTAEEADDAEKMENLLGALCKFKDIHWVITKPNADAGNSRILEKIDGYVAKSEGKISAFTSLGSLRYLSMMGRCKVVVGNSSSGIIESASFGVPVVNIGDRQKGRVRPENVIDVSGYNGNDIADAIRRALSSEFIKRAGRAQNPYGDGCSGAKIVEKLKMISLEGIFKKEFFNMKIGGEI